MPVAGVPAAWDELITTTLHSYGTQVVDNVYNYNVVAQMLKSEQKTDHGRTMSLPVMLGTNTSIQWVGEDGDFSTTKSGELIGSAEYPWPDAMTASVLYPWKRIKMNMGSKRIIAIVDAHLKEMEEAVAQELADRCHARVDGPGGVSELIPAPDVQFLSLDQITGNAAYDADPHGDATNNDAFDVGGIDASANDRWEAKRIELPVDGTFDIRRAFRHIAHRIHIDSKKRIDYVSAGLDVYEEMEDSFDDKVRYTDFGEGETTFSGIKFDGITIVLDPDCPPKRAYFLCKKTLHMRSLDGTFMELQESQFIPGNLNRVTPIATLLNVGTNLRIANGVLLRPDTAGGEA